MRRTIAITIIAALSLAACGSSDEAADSEPTSEADDTEVQFDTDSVPDESSSDDATDDDATDDEATAGTEAEADPEPAAEKPEVDLPAELPTELERTVLREGTGDPAEAGDTIVLDYVGVRSEDGVEFDASYNRGEPFRTEIGAGLVIQGWDEGLVGSQVGERVQLDIPAELAYGDQARGEVILANTPLTFVIDVEEIIEGIDPADIPTEPGIPLSDVGVLDTEFVELEPGDGDTLELGDTALVRYVYFRADNGVVLETNWSNDPPPIPYDDALLPGLLEGMEGMQVGERRAITIPPEDGFGPGGQPQAGLPAGTDIVFVLELADIA